MTEQIGEALQTYNDLDGAVIAFRRVTAMAPTYVLGHQKLGLALRDNRDFAGAAAAYRKVIELDAKNALAHNGLGQVLLLQSQFAEARDTFKRAAELFAPSNPDNARRLEQQVVDCERLLELTKQLPALIAGELQPKENDYRLKLARYAQVNKRYAQSAQLYAAAFVADATLA